MKLEIAEFPVKQIRLSHRFKYENQVVEVDESEILALLREDTRIENATLAVALPGEKTRITGIRDLVEPRYKVSGGGQVFPGVLGAVADVGATMEWYQSKLGFWSDPFPPDPPYVFAILFRDHIEIMLQRLENYERPDTYALRPGGVWDAYIRTKGIKDLYEGIKDEVKIISTLRQQPYGAWEFVVKDPNGYYLVFSEIEE